VEKAGIAGIGDRRGIQVYGIEAEWQNRKRSMRLSINATRSRRNPEALHCPIFSVPPCLRGEMFGEIFPKEITERGFIINIGAGPQYRS
jgi:hypothetical protein